jgi:putative nucleotidyltransferase with HDIG domain
VTPQESKPVTPNYVKRMYPYTMIRSLVGIALVILTFQLPKPEDILPAIILALMMIISVELSVVIKDRTRITLGFGCLLAAVLLFPPPIAAVVSAIGFAPGILTRPVFSWSHRWKMTFSMAGYAALMGLCGGFIYQKIGGYYPLRDFNLVILLKILIVFIGLNLSLAVLILPSILLRGASWRDYLNIEFPMISIANFFGMLVGIALVFFNNIISPWAMCIIGIPLVGTMYLVSNLAEARDKLNQRLKELTILHEVSREITRLLKMEQLSDMLHHESRKIISSPGFRIALTDEESDELIIILDIVEGNRQRNSFASAANTFEEFVLQTGKPLKIDRWPDQALEIGLSCREMPWVRSYLGVPMIFDKKVLGVIGVRSPEPQAYTDHHLEILSHFANNTAVTIENSRLFREVQESFIGTIEALIKIIDAKDPYTKFHSTRVADLSSEIAKQMGILGDDREQIRLAALLHDIGKVGLPESLLHKKSELDDQERDIMKQHPERGAELIQGIKKLKEIVPAIQKHHERIDGEGYPMGLKGSDIPISARILAVADSFDAIISKRPYREPLPVDDAIREIRRCKGTQFDPDVVDAFELIYATDKIKSLYRTNARVGTEI